LNRSTLTEKTWAS